jgi:hypothetical protein
MGDPIVTGLPRRGNAKPGEVPSATLAMLTMLTMLTMLAMLAMLTANTRIASYR